MKKRMFITTIVMMLVLAVALTTSSLAWFSSANITVTAQSATFTAASAGSSNVNLKISDSLGTWGNQISLTSGGRTMSGLVPTEPLISDPTVGDDITTTGVTVNAQPVAVTHKGYKWPARMTFNSAKIGSESNFVIDTTTANSVKTYASTAQNSSENYYFDYFYIQNADSQNSLGSLTFKVTSQLSVISGEGAQPGDYTARGYVAFIIFDQVNFAANSVIPDNAWEYAGKTVVAYDTASVDTTTQVKELTKTVGNETVGAGITTWIPFAAFTFATAKGTNDTVQADEWQFADLDALVSDDSTSPYYDTEKTVGTFFYNNANITSLNTQHYDALTGNGDNDGFVLNTDSLRMLNNKIVNGDGDVAVRGGDTSPTETNIRSAATKDTSSAFVMEPGEIFMVSMYYWLDGYSLTEYTDTTVSQIGLTISAAR